MLENAVPHAGHGHDPETVASKTKLLLLFGGTALGGLGGLRLLGVDLPRLRFTDLLVLGLATNRFSRIVSREKIGEPVRAPFTEKSGDEAQPERPAGHGMRRAIGELLTCPRCTAVWGALALYLGFAVAPRPARALGSLLAMAAVSDLVNTCYAKKR